MSLQNIFNGPLTQTRWKALGKFLSEQYIRCGPGLIMNQVQGQIVISSIRKPSYGPREVLPPFHCDFGKEGDQWFVTVTPGVVVDHITKKGNALNFLEAPGLMDDKGALKKFSIAEGEAVYVVVEVDESGEPKATSGSPVSVTVDKDGKESSHYIPPVGDEEYGEKGTYYYKLAKFNGPSSDKIAELVLSGSHVSHYRDLPKIKNAGGNNQWFKEYDADSGEYKIKGLSADTPGYYDAVPNLVFTDTEDEIKAKVVGANLNLKIFPLYQNTYGVISEGEQVEATLCWRNGLFVGRFEGTASTPAAEGAIIEQRVNHFVGEPPYT